jgi:hypothetical protein
MSRPRIATLRLLRAAVAGYRRALGTRDGINEGGDIHVMLTKMITKKAQKTNHFERFHMTPWPRQSRLERTALAFSKKLGYHIGAIKRFIDVTTY